MVALILVEKMLMSLLLKLILFTFITLLQDMWEDVKMRVPALAPSNLGGACNIMKVQVILLMIPKNGGVVEPLWF